jgi:hypothetical protein
MHAVFITTILLRVHDWRAIHGLCLLHKTCLLACLLQLVLLVLLIVCVQGGLGCLVLVILLLQ